MKGSALAAIPVLTLALSACGTRPDETESPTACRAGAGTYERALTVAPGAVRLVSETGRYPISDCLVAEQTAGDLASVGTAMVRTANELNAAARAHPGGPENVQLGYLLGAARRGAGPSGGIHANLLDRLDTAAHFSPGGAALPPAFGVALASGEAAGAETG